MSASVLRAIGEVVEGGGEPDDVLRTAVDVLAAEPGIAWAGIAFSEEGRLVLGPKAGEPDQTRRTAVPVLFDGREVGELRVDGDAKRELLERVAALISAHVLIGWDTAGEAWDP